MSYEIIHDNGVWAGPFECYTKALAALETGKQDGTLPVNVGRLRIVQVMASFDSFAADSDATTVYPDDAATEFNVARAALQEILADGTLSDDAVFGGEVTDRIKTLVLGSGFTLHLTVDSEDRLAAAYFRKAGFGPVAVIPVEGKELEALEDAVHSYLG